MSSGDEVRGFELPFAVLTVGFAIALIPGDVYLQTADEVRGAVPLLLLTGLVVAIAGSVFMDRRERRLQREFAEGSAKNIKASSDLVCFLRLVRLGRSCKGRTTDTTVSFRWRLRPSPSGGLIDVTTPRHKNRRARPSTE